MKRMLIVFTVGIVLFATSAGVSFVLQRTEPAHHAEKETPEKKVPTATAKGEETAPSLQQRPTSTGPENVVQMANTLRLQQESLKNREQSLQKRQKDLELIYQDMRNEQKDLDDLRKQIGVEMQTLTERLDSVNHKSADLTKQKLKLTDEANQIKQSVYEMDAVEQKQIRKMATMYDTMDADTAGEILQQMADGGKIDMAVKILATMQERSAARVLAQISDRATVVQILDRMKGLKKSPAE